ncbi:hypothetical protein OIU34_19820 [Pararhizobium sp. BT-229]|uniref:hypothetical protein n=1 Tax=Pararhizobium sp. BT-229 TaxID=2986923 RepID=UPI0021F7F084|nr:hypothetical protein [Pararhizobium sp. BT-229]MCV9964134.1 hypothetical protein [Pararhizobium sp. BT-229]
MASDPQKMERLVERLGFLVGKNGEGFGGRSSIIAAAFRLADPITLANLLREFGDTHVGAPLVHYIKQLEALDFEQFADFPLPTGGRTLAFVRNRGCVLAVFGIEPDRPPSLDVVASSIGADFYGHPVGFPNDVVRLNSTAPSSYRIAFDGISGLRIKLHQLDSNATFSDAWWSLDDRGYDLPSDIGTELVRRRERFLCEDYNDIKCLVEARREAVPSLYRFQFDADHRFKLSDILSRPHVSTPERRIARR